MEISQTTELPDLEFAAMDRWVWHQLYSIFRGTGLAPFHVFAPLHPFTYFYLDSAVISSIFGESDKNIKGSEDLNPSPHMMQTLVSVRLGCS